MAVHQRKLKLIEFGLGAEQFECQIRSWKLNNNTPDGDKGYTFCPDGAYIEETEPDWSLDLTFLSDWRTSGVSHYLTTNDGTDVPFALDHHPDIPGEHVQWTGTVHIKAPSVGGDARTTETSEVTLQLVGEPTYTRI